MQKNRKYTAFVLVLMIVFLSIVPLLSDNIQAETDIYVPQEFDISAENDAPSSPYFAELMLIFGWGCDDVNARKVTMHRAQERISERRTSFSHMTFQSFNKTDILLLGSQILRKQSAMGYFYHHVLIPHSIHAPPFLC